MSADNLGEIGGERRKQRFDLDGKTGNLLQFAKLGGHSPSSGTPGGSTRYVKRGIPVSRGAKEMANTKRTGAKATGTKTTKRSPKAKPATKKTTAKRSTKTTGAKKITKRTAKK